MKINGVRTGGNVETKTGCDTISDTFFCSVLPFILHFTNVSDLKEQEAPSSVLHSGHVSRQSTLHAFEITRRKPSFTVYLLLLVFLNWNFRI